MSTLSTSLSKTSLSQVTLAEVLPVPPHVSGDTLVTTGTRAGSHSERSNIGYVIMLLPTGSEERGVLGVGSILAAILPSCQVMKTFAV